MAHRTPGRLLHRRRHTEGLEKHQQHNPNLGRNRPAGRHTSSACAPVPAQGRGKLCPFAQICCSSPRGATCTWVEVPGGDLSLCGITTKSLCKTVTHPSPVNRKHSASRVPLCKAPSISPQLFLSLPHPLCSSAPGKTPPGPVHSGNLPATCSPSGSGSPFSLRKPHEVPQATYTHCSAFQGSTLGATTTEDVCILRRWAALNSSTCRNHPVGLGAEEHTVCSGVNGSPAGPELPLFPGLCPKFQLPMC